MPWQGVAWRGKAPQAVSTPEAAFFYLRRQNMAARATKTAEPVALGGDVSNSGEHAISLEIPYMARVSVKGIVPILWHRWQSDAVEEKAAAKKGSAAKKTDNVESYVWRDDAGFIGLPGLYLLGSMTDPRNGAAKYRQDPRSPRKSALDLYRAGVMALTDLAPIHRASDGKTTKEWDYLDRRRVTVQRAGITRERPAFAAGWTATVELMVATPEYISPTDLLDVLTKGGQLVGVGDFRPTFGRFQVTSFATSNDPDWKQ
jgi:hypothetical protein